MFVIPSLTRLNMPAPPRIVPHRLLLIILIILNMAGAAACAADNGLGSGEPSGWDVNDPPGPKIRQPIDVTEGTWLNLDVSPDGSNIVFDLLGDIYVMPVEADGTRSPRKLTSGMAWDMQPRYSPDGQWIAFTSDRLGDNGKAGDNIWVMTASGEQITQVTNESYRLLNGPAWSPDGQYIVARKHFTSRRSLGAGEMWMYHRDALRLKATGGVQLTKRPTDQKDVNEPIFSPDGKHLYYSEDVWPGSTFEYDKDSNKQIYVIKRLNLTSGKTETYISGPGGACRPTPSPDGAQIAFVRRVDGKSGLHLFDAASGQVKLVYGDLERDMQETWAIHGVYPSFAWMPDGKSLVFWARGKIRRLELASGGVRTVEFRIQDTREGRKSLRHAVPVAEDKFDVRMLQHVQAAPDGGRIVFQALGRVYVRDRQADGGYAAPRPLTRQQEHFEFMPSVSRDGKYVAYVSWHDQRLGAIRVASLDPQNAESWQVTNKPGHYRNPVISPDGKTVVFEKAGGGGLTSPLWSHETGLYQIPTHGGAALRFSLAGRSPRFAAASDRVFFLKGQREKDADNLGLYSVPLSPIHQDVLPEPQQHYNSDWATDYVLSPDGKQIAFVERFRVYVAPFVQTGQPIQVGPDASNLPITQASTEAGQWLHFSGDSKQLHWALGPDYYTLDLAAPDQASHVAIGFQHRHAQPKGLLALVNGKVYTMTSDEPLDDAVVLIQGNRIQAVGKRGQVKVPPTARVLDLQGRIVLPGLVDTHAHGPQAANGVVPQRSWVDYARLAFGVTTIHDPSNSTNDIFAASELGQAGRIVAPRTFSTGTILYGATGAGKAEIQSLEDARFHLRRMKAVGAFTVKSYNQPRRDQRQQVIAAARELGMMVVPEGGATFMHNMSMIVDGHTGIEHTLSVQTAYDDVLDLWRDTGVGYTPTLCVAYGGISGEQYWYQVDDLWRHPRLQSFIPPHVLNPRSRRRSLSPQEDYNHIRVAEIAKARVDDGGLVQAGGHGQLNGICTHWELWSFVQGGMTPLEALRCGTIYGAKYLGLDGDLGSIAPGKLADILVMERGADPTQQIRDSERIEWVVANGRVFDAKRMNAHGDAAPRPPFYWESEGYGGVSAALPRTVGCGCHREGAMGWLAP